MSALGQERTSHALFLGTLPRLMSTSRSKETPLPVELTYQNEAAAGYDRAFAPITTHFVPFLLRAAHIAPGMRVLDIATGTGLASEAALALLGPTGHVIVADLST